MRDDTGRFAVIPGAARFYAFDIWSDRPPEYRPVFTELYRRMERLAAGLMRVFAVALDRPEDYFDAEIDCHFNTCPLNNYSAPTGDPTAGMVANEAHAVVEFLGQRVWPTQSATPKAC